MNSHFTSSEILSIMKMARIAMATVPEVVQEEMDISDEEFMQLRDRLTDFLGK